MTQPMDETITTIVDRLYVTDGLDESDTSRILITVQLSGYTKGVGLMLYGVLVFSLKEIIDGIIESRYAPIGVVVTREEKKDDQV